MESSGHRGLGRPWLALAPVFEFGFGHYVAHKTWTELLADYNGRPYLAARAVDDYGCSLRHRPAPRSALMPASTVRPEYRGHPPAGARKILAKKSLITGFNH